MNPITDRIRVFLFGISIAFMGLVNPMKALQTVDRVFNDWRHGRRAR
jgi:hypothetical protein